MTQESGLSLDVPEHCKNALLKAALCSNEANNPTWGVLEGLVLALSNCPKGKGDYSCLYSYFAELIFFLRVSIRVSASAW